MYVTAFRNVYFVPEVKIYYEKYESYLKLFEGLPIFPHGTQKIENEYRRFKVDANLST